MSNTEKTKKSPLVEAVLKLDDYLSELVRLGTKIESLDVKKDFDFEQIQKFMTRFAECGQGVSEEVINMSTALNEARGRAEAAAQLVSVRAEELQARRDEQQSKMEAFAQLGEKVRQLTLSLNELKNPAGETITAEERAQITTRLSDFEAQLNPLIQEARNLKKEAQDSKLKTLEQGADSLAQSLVSIGQKLTAFQQTQVRH